MIKELTAAVISLAIVFQVVDKSEPAQAVTCSVSGGQSERLKYSGQVTPVSATVCGNQIWKLIGKPKKPTKPVKPVKPTKPKKYANNFTVIPDRPKIEGSQNVTLGSSADFRAVAITHTRNRLLFWYPSQVQFTPKTFSWSFGDGQISNESSTAHSWISKGAFLVKLLVGYSVKYRIIGHSKWVSLNGLVYAASLPLPVNVGVTLPQSSGKVVLVHWRCDQKPNALGC